VATGGKTKICQWLASATGPEKTGFLADIKKLAQVMLVANGTRIVKPSSVKELM
jgi:hypothetical protein